MTILMRRVACPTSHSHSILTSPGEGNRRCDLASLFDEL